MINILMNQKQGLTDYLRGFDDPIYLRILPTPSRAFLAGTARQGHEKKKVKSMIVSLFQDDRLKLDR